MAMNYTDEEYHQISLEEYLEGESKPNLFAVSRVFAEARKQMTAPEFRIFAYALSQIKWKETCPDTLYLDKKTIAKLAGVHSDIDHLSVDLNRSIGDMPKHSFLRFSDRHKGIYVNGNFVRTITMLKNVVRIRLEDEFLGLFGNLETDYITMWSKDFEIMKTERAMAFYEFLRDNSDTRLVINEGTMSIKKFKELFDIPKDGKGSYMTSDGHFARTHFERFVIDPICEELSKTEMIKLIIQPSKKYYEKVKEKGKVIAYRFYWTVTLYPRVATAEEVKQIQERVDKNPEVLKISKDIVKGEKKRKEKSEKNAFNNFEQNVYNFDELEKDIISNYV